MQIPDIRTASNYVKNKFNLTFLREWRGSYGVTAMVFKSPSGKIYIVQVSNDFFRRFSFIFPQCQGMGWGNSVSYSLLKFAAEQDAILITVMKETGVVYGVAAAEVLNFVETCRTVRIPTPEEQEYASYPISMLTKLYPREGDSNGK